MEVSIVSWSMGFRDHGPWTPTDRPFQLMDQSVVCAVWRCQTSSESPAGSPRPADHVLGKLDGGASYAPPQVLPEKCSLGKAAESGHWDGWMPPSPQAKGIKLAEDFPRIPLYLPSSRSLSPDRHWPSQEQVTKISYPVREDTLLGAPVALPPQTWAGGF